MLQLASNLVKKIPLVKHCPKGSHLLRWFFENNRQEVQSLDELASWLSAHASHVGQSSMYAYTRARLGLMMGKAFSEEIFSRALFEAALRSQYYIMCDLALLMAHCYERTLGKDAKQLQPAFQKLFNVSSSQIGLVTYKKTLDENNKYEKLSEEEIKDLALVVPLSLEAAFDEARSRFEMVLPAVLNPSSNSLDAKSIANFSSRKVFELIPLSERMKYLDEEMVINNTTFRMMRFYEDISRDSNQQKFTLLLSGNDEKN